MSQTTADFYSHLAGLRGADDLVIATMTACVEWPQHSTHDLDLGFMAPMGSASSLGLGLALARPEIGVIVIDGDGSVLMNLGSIVTIGGQRPARFLHVVMENDGYDITGGQPLPGRGTQPLPEMALAAGYRSASRWETEGDLDAAVDAMHAGQGPILLAVPVQRSFDLASLGTMTHHEQCQRTLGRPGAEQLRRALEQVA